MVVAPRIPEIDFTTYPATKALPFRYGVEIGSSTSIMGPSIPARTREVLISHLASYNMWALQGM